MQDGVGDDHEDEEHSPLPMMSITDEDDDGVGGIASVTCYLKEVLMEMSSLLTFP